MKTVYSQSALRRVPGERGATWQPNVTMRQLGHVFACSLSRSAFLLGLMAAGEVWMFFLCSVILGFASGGAATLTSPLVAELFGVKSHGLILGVFGLCFTFGSAAGPFMAGYMFDVTGSYQLVFLVAAFIGIAGFLLAATLRPTKKPENKIP